MSNWYRYLENLWYRPNCLSWLLLPFSQIYLLVMFFQRYIAKKRSLAKQQPPLVIIGNFHVGGQGKTPVIIALVQQLNARGYQLAVICKPYHVTQLAEPRFIDLYQDRAAIVGDEPLLIAKQTKVPVVVASCRRQAITYLQQQNLRFDLLLMDDGLQDWQIASDYRCAVIDPLCCLLPPRLLPAGPLRQPWNEITTVDALLWREYQGQWPTYHVQQWTWQAQLDSRAVNLNDPAKTKLLADFAGKKVLILAAIARAERFVQALATIGIVGESLLLADHHYCDHLAGLADPSFIVLMTEKDAVKYQHQAQANWYSVGLKVCLPETWLEHMLNHINLKR